MLALLSDYSHKSITCLKAFADSFGKKSIKFLFTAMPEIKGYHLA